MTGVADEPTRPAGEPMGAGFRRFSGRRPAGQRVDGQRVDGQRVAGALVGRGTLAAALAQWHRRHRRRTGLGGRPGWRHGALAAGLAAGGPALAVLAAWRSGARFRAPDAAPVRGLAAAVAYATVTATAEELLWRAPLLRIAAGPRRRAVTLLAGSAFVGLHLPRDGRAGLPVHALNTASWTAATVVGRRVRWAIAAHAAYDLAAGTLRAGGGRR